MDPHTFTVKLIQTGMSDAWSVVVGAIIGVLGGIGGQWFMSWKNHKRELEKISYSFKRQELIELKVVMQKMIQMSIHNKTISAFEAKEVFINNFIENNDNFTRCSHSLCTTEFENFKKEYDNFINFLKNYYPEPESKLFVDNDDFFIKYVNLIDTIQNIIIQIEERLRK